MMSAKGAYWFIEIPSVRASTCSGKYQFTTEARMNKGELNDSVK
jgi:hypothetical protein